MTDNNGDVLSPLPVAPVNEADMLLLPEGLNALKKVAKLVGLVLTGAYLNLDSGCDSKQNRKRIFLTFPFVIRSGHPSGRAADRP